MKAVIHNEPIGELEQVIIMNRGCQSHLMRRRRWFIGMSSVGISSVARLPRLSSLAMRDDRIYGGKEENRCRVFGRWKRAKEQLRVEMCLRPKPSASI